MDLFSFEATALNPFDAQQMPADQSFNLPMLDADTGSVDPEVALHEGRHSRNQSLSEGSRTLEHHSCPYPWIFHFFVRNRSCQECGISLYSNVEFEEHVLGSGHLPFSCPYDGCSVAYSTVDVLRRHWKTVHHDHPGFPCPHCKKYQGRGAFKRKDHLTQHLRGYHHIGEKEPVFTFSCPHAGCDKFRADAFEKLGYRFRPKGHYDHTLTRREFIAHMRKVHSESPFQCLADHCDRRGGNGYFRRRDLEKHQSKEHPHLFRELTRSARNREDAMPFYFQVFM